MSDRGRSSASGGPGSERQKSQSPTRTTSRGASPARSQGPGQGGFGPGMGYDPARLSDKSREKGNTRMELPPDAYATDSTKEMFPVRGNKLNTQGRSEMIEVNQYRLKSFDFKKNIYQYDVSLRPQRTPVTFLFLTLYLKGIHLSAPNQGLQRYSSSDSRTCIVSEGS